MKYRLMQFLFGGPGTASALGDFGLLVVRVAFGAYIALHGWDKLHTSGGGVRVERAIARRPAADAIPAPTGWVAVRADRGRRRILVCCGLLTPAGGRRWSST